MEILVAQNIVQLASSPEYANEFQGSLRSQNFSCILKWDVEVWTQRRNRILATPDLRPRAFINEDFGHGFHVVEYISCLIVIIHFHEPVASVFRFPLG
jgi:hypothetical protein